MVWQKSMVLKKVKEERKEEIEGELHSMNKQ